MNPKTNNKKETKIILSKLLRKSFLSITDLVINTAPIERAILNPTVKPDGFFSPDNTAKVNPNIARAKFINQRMVKNFKLDLLKSINSLIGIAIAIAKLDDNARGPMIQTFLKL